MAGGSGPNGTRYNTAEILVRGAPSWVNITATIPTGPLTYFSGINLNDKVYFLGKFLKVIMKSKEHSENSSQVGNKEFVSLTNC